MVAITDEFVEFKFYRPGASEVYLVGDFNNWRRSQIRMHRGADGYWSARVRLPAGTFKFRYFADGQWFTDYAAFGVEQGPYGMDSVVRVPA